MATNAIEYTEKMTAKNLKKTLLAISKMEVLLRKGISQEEIQKMQQEWFKFSTGGYKLKEIPETLQEHLDFEGTSLLYDTEWYSPDTPGIDGSYVNKQFTLIKFDEEQGKFQKVNLIRREFYDSFDFSGDGTGVFQWEIITQKNTTLLEIFKYSPNIVNDIMDTWDFNTIMKTIKLT